MSMPARWLKSSPARCEAEPAPVEAYSTLPGFVLDSAMNSARFFTPAPLCTTSTLGNVHTARDGSQILEPVVAEFHQVRRDRQRADRTEQQHRAVGHGIGDELVGDVAASAPFVVHHHGLADVLAQLLGDQARGRIGGAAGGKAHHQRDRLLGGGKSWTWAIPARHTAEVASTVARNSCRLFMEGLLGVVIVQSAPRPIGLGWRFSTAWRSSAAVRKMPCANLP